MKPYIALLQIHSFTVIFYRTLCNFCFLCGYLYVNGDIHDYITRVTNRTETNILKQDVVYEINIGITPEYNTHPTVLG